MFRKSISELKKECNGEKGSTELALEIINKRKRKNASKINTQKKQDLSSPETSEIPSNKSLDKKERLKKYRKSPVYKACREKYRKTDKHKACQKRYTQSEKGKKRNREYQQTPQYKKYQQWYRQTPQYKARQKAYRETPEYKKKRCAYRKEYNKLPEVQERARQRYAEKKKAKL